MKSINYQEVPSTIAEDCNKSKTTWQDGKLVSMDEGTRLTLFIGHRSIAGTGDDGTAKEITEAFAIRIQKPYSIDKAVASAVMSAYGLSTLSEYAALSEEMARRHRMDAADAEVSDYDAFVSWVRGCLDGTYSCRLDEVKARVLSEIETYDKSNNVNGFVYNGKTLWLSKEERLSLIDRFGRELEEGVEQTNLFYGGEAIPLAPADALILVKKVSSYADKCFDQTQRHKNNVSRISTIEELEAYDFTTGYPSRLVLSTNG